jgi:hypothetical protein
MLGAFADPHTSMAYVNVDRRIVLYTVSLKSRESSEILLRRVLKETEFTVKVSLVSGFHGVGGPG